jgi:hypothetical protein
MINYSGSGKIESIPVIKHKVGEKVMLLSGGSYPENPRVTIQRISDNYYFNKASKLFEEFSSINSESGNYIFTMNKLYNTGVYQLPFVTLPSTRQSLLFTIKTLSEYNLNGITASDNAISEATAEDLFVTEVPEPGSYEISFSLAGGVGNSVSAEVVINGTDVANTLVSIPDPGTVQTFYFQLNNLFSGDEVKIKAWASGAASPPTISNAKLYRLSYERHVFGEEDNSYGPPTTLLYGTLLDVSGRPISGQKVEVYLNKAGYFTHKAGVVGYASSTITNESGYWELPVMIGIDITISIPVVGFIQSGYVPPVASVELNSETLLRYRPNV